MMNLIVWVSFGQGSYDSNHSIPKFIYGLKAILLTKLTSLEMRISTSDCHQACIYFIVARNQPAPHLNQGGVASHCIISPSSSSNNTSNSLATRLPLHLQPCCIFFTPASLTSQVVYFSQDFVLKLFFALHLLQVMSVHVIGLIMVYWFGVLTFWHDNHSTLKSSVMYP